LSSSFTSFTTSFRFSDFFILDVCVCDFDQLLVGYETDEAETAKE
jgi:hypothetical protein